MTKDGKISKAFVAVNPASGKAEPVLSILNKVFTKYEVEWDVAVTHKYGDAKEYIAEAAKKDYDVLIGYGGDGTQHEVVEGIMGTGKLMGILPGGTGNGFAAGLDISDDTEEALEMLCNTTNVIDVDVAKLDSGTFFLSRLYTGIDPEDQTTREMKDKYGVFAYAVGGYKRRKKMVPVGYTITVDGEVFKADIIKCYVVNSGSTGVGVDIGQFSPLDGVLDIFALDGSMHSYVSAADRFLHLKTKLAETYIQHGTKMKIETDKPQSVWADGEYIGKTPIEITLEPGGLKVLADKPTKHK